MSDVKVAAEGVKRLRTYYVEVVGWPEVASMVIGKSRAHAIYKQWFHAKDAGYNVPWTKFRAKAVSPWTEVEPEAPRRQQEGR